ncbi:hypothetical protein EV122DRAFT_289060 [Schizophyllum commune]
MDSPPYFCCPDHYAIATHLRTIKTLKFTLKANKLPPSDWNLFHYCFCREFSPRINPVRNSTLSPETRKIRMGTLAGRHWRELPQDELRLWRNAAKKLRQQHRNLWPNFVHNQAVARSEDQHTRDVTEKKNESTAEQAAKSYPPRGLGDAYLEKTVMVYLQGKRTAGGPLPERRPKSKSSAKTCPISPTLPTFPTTAEVSTPRQEEIPSAPFQDSVLCVGKRILTPPLALSPIGLEGFPALSLKDFLSILPNPDSFSYALAFP